MSLVTLATAKAQSKILNSAEDTLLQGYIDAAEYYAQEYLDRSVFADSTALTAAKAAVATLPATAQSAYTAAITAATALPAGLEQDSATAQADEDFAQAQKTLARTRYGMVLTPAFTQAVVLLVAHWYVNREPVLIDFSKAVELPFGVTNLLSIDRRQMGV